MEQFSHGIFFSFFKGLKFTQIMMTLILLIDLKTFTFDWNIYKFLICPQYFFPGGIFSIFFVEIIFCGIFSFFKKNKHFNSTYMNVRHIFVMMNSI